jgi:hypothetical protein
VVQDVANSLRSKVMAAKSRQSIPKIVDSSKLAVLREGVQAIAELA